VKRPPTRHIDEARSELIASIRKQFEELALEKILVIEDAFGRFSLGCWGDRSAESSLQKSLDTIAPFGASLFWAPTPTEFDPLDLTRSWDEASLVFDDKDDIVEGVRLIVRHRMLPAWQQCREESLWTTDTGDACPIIAFYSFKGGMGRTTALAAFAIQRARVGEHVVVVDLDLDAPGLGSVLPAVATPPFGVVDYLLEMPVIGRQPDELLDYSCIVDLGKIPTSGSIRMFTAGRLDRHYLGKIARLDFEQPGEDTDLRHPLDELLLQIRDRFKPDWLLLDSRTGFSETAGMLLSGLAHLHVLVGVASEQSWEGLAYAVRKLGEERVMRGYSQGEVLLVHGLVPTLNRDALDDLTQRFSERARDLFKEAYYAADDDDHRDENLWYVSDAIGDSSPHWPWTLSYSTALAQTVKLNDLVDALDSNTSGYMQFCDALAARANRGEQT